MKISDKVSLRFVRYLLVGGLNTAVTYALFVGLSWIVHFEIAYLIAYVAGIGSSYLMNSYLVFRKPPTGYTASMFVVIYAGQYLYGSAVLWLLVQEAGIETHFAAIAVIVSSAILTYLLLRILFGKSGPASKAGAIDGAAVAAGRMDAVRRDGDARA